MPPAPPRPRLPYIPALDGLRAVAVVAVLLYHHDVTLVPGGWLGVSLFFTLSGFLIGGILLAEHGSTGRVDAPAFWVRRIRRLLPASVVALGLAALVAAGREGGARTADIVDLRAAVLQVANWRFIGADTPYAGAEGAASPVQHYWSLAIEEQFYVVFPLLVALLAGRRALPWVVGGLLAGSTALQVVIGDRDRVYFGTDTRLAELLVGVALAMAFPAIVEALRDRRVLADAWGAVALVAAVVAFGVADLTGDLVGAAGLTAVTVVWVGLLVAATCGRVVPALLGLSPLVGLGRISYGVYLYHWPVYLYLTGTRTGYDGWSLFAVRSIATLALATASFLLLELPIRHGFPTTRRLVPAAGIAVAAVVAATVWVPAGNDLVGDDLVVASAPPVVSTTVPSSGPSTGRPGSAAVPTGAPATVPRPDPGSSAPPTTRGGGTGSDPTAPTSPATAPETGPSTPSTTVPATAPPPTTDPRRVPRLLVVGDSTARATGEALQQVAAEDGVAEVHLITGPGCAVARQQVAKVREGYEYVSPCGDIIGKGFRHAADVDADAVILLVGSAQLLDASYDGLGDEFRSFLDPAVLARYRQAIDTGIGYLAGRGIPVLWADVPTPDWDPDTTAQIHGAPVPGEGPATGNDPARAAELNRIDGDIDRRHANARRWGYTAAVAGSDGVIDRDDRPDGLHLSPEAARRLSRSHFLPLLQRAFADVHADPAADLVARSATTWHPA